MRHLGLRVSPGASQLPFPMEMFQPYRELRTQQKVCCRHTELSQLTSIPNPPEIIKLSHQIQYWMNQDFSGIIFRHFSGITHAPSLADLSRLFSCGSTRCARIRPFLQGRPKAGKRHRLALPSTVPSRDGEPWFMLWSLLRKNHHLVLSSWWSWISVKLGWRPNTWRPKNLATSLLDFAQSKT